MEEWDTITAEKLNKIEEGLASSEGTEFFIVKIEEDENTNLISSATGTEIKQALENKKDVIVYANGSLAMIDFNNISNIVAEFLYTANGYAYIAQFIISNNDNSVEYKEYGFAVTEE